MTFLFHQLLYKCHKDFMANKINFNHKSVSPIIWKRLSTFAILINLSSCCWVRGVSYSLFNCETSKYGKHLVSVGLQMIEKEIIGMCFDIVSSEVLIWSINSINIMATGHLLFPLECQDNPQGVSQTLVGLLE